MVDEAERAIEDAIGAVSSAIDSGAVVAGGGAAEIEIARKLKEYAEQVGGREQLAIEAFAESLEIIPRTLAESAGMDAIETVVKLRAEHAQGKKWLGVDVLNASVADMWKANVIEPAKVKTQAIASAAEAAEMILKIDDIIAAKKVSGEDKEKGTSDFGGDEF